MAAKNSKVASKQTITKKRGTGSFAIYAAVFLLGFATLYFGTPPLMNDPDTPWHLAAGKDIRALGHVPASDTWSYTTTQQRWYNLSWAWDVLISMIEDMVGLSGLFIFSCLCGAGVITFLAKVLHVRVGHFDDAVFMVLAIVALTYMAQYGARPQLFTEALALLWLWGVPQLMRQRAWQYILPLSMVLWGNFHGGFFVAFTILGAYAFQAWTHRQWPYMRQLVITGALSAAMLCINPLGIYVFYGALRTLLSDITPYLSEWQPMVFNASTGFDIALIAMIVASGFRDKTIPVAEKILAFAWMMAALLTVRHLFLAVLMVAPYLVRSLAKTLPHIRQYRVPQAYYHPAAALGTVVGIVLLTVFPVREAATGRSRILSAEEIPVAAFHFIREHYPHQRFLNEFFIGGHMVYYNRDVHQVFTDGRVGTAYSEADLADIIRLMRGEDVNEILRRHQVTGVILPSWRNAFKITELQNPNHWNKVYDDGVGEVYIRAVPQH